MHWDWQEKVFRTPDFSGYSVVCDDLTQGLMLLDLTKTSRLPGCQKGQSLVYVAYLEAAPWNWKLPEQLAISQTYRSVGQVLMRAAVKRSFEEGFEGRVGLHSLPQAVEFYEKCSFTRLDSGMNEPVEELPYLEITSDDAKAFLK